MSTWLIDTALYTALLIALLLVLRRPVARHFGPGMAYALWALPLLRLVLPPLVLPASLAPAPEAAPAAMDASTLALLAKAEAVNAATASAPASEGASVSLCTPMRMVFERASSTATSLALPMLRRSPSMVVAIAVG